MYCTNGFGYGYYWRFSNTLFILILLAGAAALIYRLFMNNDNRVSGRSIVSNYFHSPGIENLCPSCGTNVNETYLRCPECNYKLRSNCPSCSKIIKTDWVVCPYCETKLK